MKRVRLIGALVAVCVVRQSVVEAQTLAPLDASQPVPVFISTGEERDGFRSSDPELAQWALDAWQRAAGGKLTFIKSATEAEAVVRVYWASPGGGQYGEMVPVRVRGRRGAAVFIRPDTRALGPEIAAQAAADPLFREAIVYLTCLHELGHALGLMHTDGFADIMYFFGFGGDITEYFARFRRALGVRDDIASTSGLSAGDAAQLESLYPEPP